MQYSLGIDAGGTYTDAVIIRDSDGEVIDSNKAMTTYPDLLIGIRNTIDGLDQEYLKDVKMVSVSTTLATNTILEKTGYPVGLILVGNYNVNDPSAISPYIQVSGGHTNTGAEIEPLDIEAVEDFVMKLKDKASAFAVSSYFSVRNPEHELKIKARIHDLTGLPVVCGHELSQDLGAYERGVTAYLNAQLIPIAKQFMESVISEIKRRDMDAKVLMLKCDGSVVGIKEGLKKPIESIFSGPAASLVGASYLSKLDTCAVIDVGGTSTDVSLIQNKLPELSDEGAMVGGWKTKVKAIRMETSAMGGDSHVWVKNMKAFIGPRRVIPLCVAAVKYPGFLEQVKKGRIPSRFVLGENIQPTKFFVRTGKEPGELSKIEQDIYDLISDQPVSMNDMFWKLGSYPSPVFVDILIQKRLIQAIGFTPTDALHVRGEYTEWDVEASRAGAKILAKMTGMDMNQFCSHIKREVAKNMALNLVSYLLTDVKSDEIAKVLDSDAFTKFKVEVPVVLLGGPVQAYVDELKEVIEAEIILPEYADVGNAVGALVGKGIKRVEMLIKPVHKKNQKSILLFTPLKREMFSTYSEAMEYAETQGKKLIIDYMREAGLDEKNVKVDIHKEDIAVSEAGLPVETKLTFVGVAGHKIEIEEES